MNSPAKIELNSIGERKSTAGAWLLASGFDARTYGMALRSGFGGDNVFPILAVSVLVQHRRITPYFRGYRARQAGVQIQWLVAEGFRSTLSYPHFVHGIHS